MNIQFQSDVGRRRNTNQDYTKVFRNQLGIQLAILADGMGGHLAGDVASKMAVTDLGSAWETSQLQEEVAIKAWLIERIQAENRAIHDLGLSQAEYAGMGTTIVAVAILEEKVVIANVGDSRAYLLRNHEMEQVTEDHSLVHELVKSGEITQEMAANHPRKNILTRSVGMPGDVTVDVTEKPFLVGDYLLLCSDGLTNMVSDAEITRVIFQSESLADKVERLIYEANEAGGADNITVLIIQCEEEAPC